MSNNIHELISLCHSALDKVAEKLLSNNNALEESNIIDNDDREGKIKDIIDKLKILNEFYGN